MKCQICKNAPAEWAWQPFGPHDGPLSFALLGGHYRGFPVIKVCGFCKAERIENCAEPGEPVRFVYKYTPYVFDGKQPPYCPELWDGGTSADDSGDYTMLCRDTPGGHDIVASVYDPTLAAAIIEAYNKAQRARP